MTESLQNKCQKNLAHILTDTGCMIIAVTGHRPNKLGNEYDGQGPISKKILSQLEGILLQYKPESVISGMAQGVDQLWAEIAQKHNIPVIAALPFEKQSVVWPESGKLRWGRILQKASKIHIVAGSEYAAWKMQARNEWMVDNCDILVAVWNGTTGGTKNCIEYAKKQNKEILYVQDF